MSSCKHEILTLVQIKNNKLRCRHCHLTISADELSNGCCPECLDVHKVRRRDFDEIVEVGKDTIRYCCERCGMVVDC